MVHLFKSGYSPSSSELTLPKSGGFQFSSFQRVNWDFLFERRDIVLLRGIYGPVCLTGQQHPGAMSSFKLRLGLLSCPKGFCFLSLLEDLCQCGWKTSIQGSSSVKSDCRFVFLFQIIFKNFMLMNISLHVQVPHACLVGQKMANDSLVVNYHVDSRNQAYVLCRIIKFSKPLNYLSSLLLPFYLVSFF